MANDLLEDLLASVQEEKSTVTFEDEDLKLAPLLEEINLIQDQGIRQFVRSILFHVETFWIVPSSPVLLSHPPDEFGIGGNVLHTRRVVRAVWLLAESQGRPTDELDVLIAAALLHDISKVSEGPDGEYAYDIMHPYTVDRYAEYVALNDEKLAGNTTRSSTLYLIEDPETLSVLMRLIRCHEGQFSPIPETIPVSSLEWTLHLANQVACHLHVLIDGPDIKDWRWNNDTEESTPIKKKRTYRKSAPHPERSNLPQES